MSEFKNWPMLRGLPVGDLHSHRCDTCGFLWQHSTSQVARMDAAGKARAHLCQNCGASQRWIAEERPNAKDDAPAKSTEFWRGGRHSEQTMSSRDQAEKLLAARSGAVTIMVETDLLRCLIGECDEATKRADRAHDLAAKHYVDLEHERRQHAYWRDRHNVDVQERTAAWQRGNEEIARLRAEAQERDHALLRLSRDGGRLADEVDALIARRVIDARSPVADALLDFRDPPRSPRSCRLAALEQELAAAMVRAEKAERERDVLALNQGRPWALPDVLRRLADAADHLLRDHGCDIQGYEGIGLARDEARLLLTGLDESKKGRLCT